MPFRVASRIEAWPWVKTIALVGVASYLAAQVAALAVAGTLIGWPHLRPPTADLPLLDRLVRVFELVSDAAIWAMATGALGVAAKRATAKASVIDAETRAADATVARATGMYPVPVPAPVVPPVAPAGDQPEEYDGR